MPQQSIYPNLTGQALIDKLRQDYEPSQTLGYDRARDELYRYLDTERGQLVGVYGGYSVDIPANEDPSSYAYQNGSGISAEHTWPQSKGAGSEPQKSDMHSLFPVKQTINSARGNYPYDDVVDADTDTWYRLDQSQSSTPTSSIDAFSEFDSQFPNSANYSSRFEPREAHKGNAARAVFYFYVVHNGAISDPNFFSAQKEELIEWHGQDPIDQNEYDRSQWIASKQGTNNPFVLDTTLVRRAFQSASGPTLSLSTATKSVSEGGGSFSLTITLNNPDGNSVSADLALDTGSSSADASDFGSFSTQTVSFSSSASDGATRSVSITLTDDGTAEGTESGIFQLKNVQSSGSALIGSPSTTDVSVNDNDGTPANLVISQYAEDGDVKGVELWNTGSSAIDFSNQSLNLNRYANGSGSPTTAFTKSSGTLAAGDVLVVADGGANNIWANSGITYEQANVGFNGNDALEVVLDGQTADVFGTIGSDPGSAWSGSGVSTIDQNIMLKEGVTAGDTNGWIDPSIRFAKAASAPLDDGSDGDLYGFGTAPGQVACEEPTGQPTNLSLSPSSTTIDGSLTAESTADGRLIVRSTSSSLTSQPTDGTSYSSGDALGGGTVVASTSNTSFTASGLSSGQTYYIFVYSLGTTSRIDGACMNGPNYQTAPPLAGSATTTSGTTTTLFSEPFDDATQYSITTGSDSRDGSDNYFTRTDGSAIDKNYSGVSGSFFAGQDLDDGQVLGSTPGVLTWSDINISGATNLSFSGKFGEADDGGDIDDDDYLLVEYRIDGGSWQNLIAFENDGSQYNTDFLEDTDFDGIGDGTNITSSSGLTSFSKSISGTGTSLDLRFTGSVDSGDEDFAIDDFEVSGAVSGSQSPIVSFNNATRSVSEGNNGSQTINVKVSVTDPDPNLSTSADVEVKTGTATSGSDYSFQTTTLTFSAGSSGPKSVPLTVLGDSDVEGDETVTLTLTNISGGDGATAGSPSDVSIEITGDDASAPSDGDILISEVMPDPNDVSDSNGEYVEVYNATTRRINLKGWTLDDLEGAHTIASDVEVSGHGYALLCRTVDAASSGTCDYTYGSSPALANSGDEVILKNGTGTEVDRVEYTGSWPFSSGGAMVYTGTSTQDNNVSSNWAESSIRQPGFSLTNSGTDTGSPGIRGIDQRLEIAQTAESVPGWRILSPPVSGLTVQWLIDNGAHVQGITGYSDGADPNVYLNYDGSKWVAAQSPSDPLDSGRGFIWNPFDKNLPTTFTTTQVSGAPSTDQTISGFTTGQTWHLLGNPFPNPVRLSGVNLSAQGFSKTIQVWDPSALDGIGSYRLRTQGVETPKFDPMSGGWVERSSQIGTTSLTFQASAQTAQGAPFYKSGPPNATSKASQSPRYVQLSLTGYESSGVPVTTDKATTLLLSASATSGRDPYDATKLTPIGSDYATLAFEGPDSAPTELRAVASYPEPSNGTVEVPLSLVVGGSPSADEYQIRWPSLELNSDWAAGLRDRVTGDLVDLRDQSGYTFTPGSSKSGFSSAAALLADHGPALPHPVPLHRSVDGTRKNKAEPRFALVVTSGALPVELSGLSASTDGRQAVLEWSTASEQSNAGFYVEHRVGSEEQPAFQDLTFIKGEGTTQEAQNYAFRTDALRIGTHEFRLRQVDADGSTHHTETVSVSVGPDAPLVLSPPAPHPASARTTLRVAAQNAQRVTVTLYDVLGRRVRQLHDAHLDAEEAVPIRVETRSLKSGAYFVRATAGGHTVTRRLMVVQ